MPLSKYKDGVVLRVRLNPGAKVTKVKGLYSHGPETWLRVAIAAPAVENKANQALCAQVASWFGVAPSHVQLESGHTAQYKKLSISGCMFEAAQQVVTNLLKGVVP